MCFRKLKNVYILFINFISFLFNLILKKKKIKSNDIIVSNTDNICNEYEEVDEGLHFVSNKLEDEIGMSDDYMDYEEPSTSCEDQLSDDLEYKEDDGYNNKINNLNSDNDLRVYDEESETDEEDNDDYNEKDMTSDIKNETDKSDFSFCLPSLNFLNNKKENIQDKNRIEDQSLLLERILGDFGVKGKIAGVNSGPVVTLYELKPEAGTKSSRVIALAGDIARSMSAVSARISVIQGKNAIGIELPNKDRETVYLKEILSKEQYLNSQYKLPIALGYSIDGKPIIVDLAKMPHLLVAGTTGSGKSVAVNAMILSLLYKLSPDKCKFIMIDPKMLELSVYNNIPNLLTPVVTEPKKAIVVLKWLTQEMERRYKLMSLLSVRNIGGYNVAIEDDKSEGDIIEKKVLKKIEKHTGEKIFEYVSIEKKKLPFIVVIIDEMADLMIVAGKEIESSLQRLAQMARASGIHLIMATQRPSVDVITGVIKANFPTRISFAVSSRIDSRTILGEQGAEQLLGRGDMLYMSPGKHIQRIHGPFVSDYEVQRIVDYLKSQFGEYDSEDILNNYNIKDSIGINNDIMNIDDEQIDELFSQAVEIVINEKKTSISYIQRRLKIGFNRAASLIETMEQKGIIGPQQSNGKREIIKDNI